MCAEEGCGRGFTTEANLKRHKVSCVEKKRKRTLLTKGTEVETTTVRDVAAVAAETTLVESRRVEDSWLDLLQFD
jgi:hypothetical protein